MFVSNIYFYLQYTLIFSEAEKLIWFSDIELLY